VMAEQKKPHSANARNTPSWGVKEVKNMQSFRSFTCPLVARPVILPWEHSRKSSRGQPYSSLSGLQSNSSPRSTLGSVGKVQKIRDGAPRPVSLRPQRGVGKKERERILGGRFKFAYVKSDCGLEKKKIGSLQKLGSVGREEEYEEKSG